MALSTIAGNFQHGFPITCILEEGAITVSASAYGPGGTKEKVATLAAEIVKDDLVYLIAGVQNTYAATKGMPVVAKLAAGTFYIGIVTSTPEWVKMPASTMAFTDCDNADWGLILSGEYYRVATVEFIGVTGVFKGAVTGDGANEVAIGAPGDLKWDVSLGTFIPVASGGTGLLPMHYVPAVAASYNILIGALATSAVAVA